MVGHIINIIHLGRSNVENCVSLKSDFFLLKGKMGREATQKGCIFAFCHRLYTHNSDPQGGGQRGGGQR